MYGHESRTPQANLGKAAGLLPNISKDLDNYQVPLSQRSRIGYAQQMESAGISRALGYNNRYEGVGSAIRMARALSKESLQERGPKPKFLQKNPSIPSYLQEADRLN